MEVQMKVLPRSHEDCKISIPGDPDTKVCAEGPYVTGKATCKGDSGGPLFISHDGHHKLIGITSYGWNPKFGIVLFPGISTLQEEVVCRRYLASVFTKVNQYVDWIENQIGGMRFGCMYIYKGRKFSRSFVTMIVILKWLIKYQNKGSFWANTCGLLKLKSSPQKLQ